jgi:hypothetical protein
MRFADIPFDPSNKILRQFAALWLLLFLALAYQKYFVAENHTAGIILACVAALIGIPGIIRPSLVRWVFVGAIVLTFPIGWLVSQVMLVILFYVVVTPIALILRLNGRDLLARKLSPNRSSFWTKKNMPQDVRSYFRQF